MKILLAEDDVKLGRVTQELLICEKCTVDWVQNGSEAVAAVKDNLDTSFDAVILDWMLPEMSGLEVCRILRSRYNYQGGIIFVTAKGELEDCIRALDAGADDYVVKPYKIKELVARLNAVCRRQTKPFVDKIYGRDGIEINRNLNTVCYDEREVTLRKKEFALFEMLFVNLNNILPHKAIFEKIWSDKPDTNMETLNSHIYMLRKSLKVFPQIHIMLVKNVGYKMEVRHD